LDDAKQPSYLDALSAFDAFDRFDSFGGLVRSGSLFLGAGEKTGFFGRSTRGDKKTANSSSEDDDSREDKLSVLSIAVTIFVELVSFVEPDLFVEAVPLEGISRANSFLNSFSVCDMAR
jgi:hypothetical protein